jgi:soluble lytic murein transglycosylase-like protein
MRASQIGVAIAVGFVLAAIATSRRQAPDLEMSDQGGAEEPEAISSAAVEIATDVIDAAKDAASGITAMIFGTKYDSLIHAAAAQAGIDPQLLYKLLYQESHFREDIIRGEKRSKVGALGIAQFMPPTAREWLGSEAAALDPNQAIPGAARYLAYLIRYFGGDVKKAVAAYNWGMGNVANKGLANAPAETRQYVLNITGEGIA